MPKTFIDSFKFTANRKKVDFNEPKSNKKKSFAPSTKDAYNDKSSKARL